MKNTLLIKVKPLKAIAFSAIFFLVFQSEVQANPFHEAVVADSIGVENNNGKEVVIHLLKPKETYYGLSQKYKIALQDLITFNGNKPLKMGETIKIPTDRPSGQSTSAPPAQSAPAATLSSQEDAVSEPEIHLNPGEFTEFIVGKGETLFSVSKRFNVPVEMIRRTNALAGDKLQQGMTLHVPSRAVVARIEEEDRLAALEPSPQVDVVLVEEPSAEEAEFEVRKNRYGIREVNEKGIGVWIDDLSQDGGSMLVLHKTAPVGTIIKITNPMTHHSTFAKVVGKYVDTAETNGAIVVISSSVASAIGILDRRFQIEIAYGAPLNDVVRRNN